MVRPMRISFSELCLIGDDPELNVDRLRSAGAEEVELMLDGRGWDGFETRQEEFAARLAGRGVRYSVHVPVWDFNLAGESFSMRSAVLESYKRSIEFAALMGACHLVVHPGWVSEKSFSKERARGRVRDSMEELARFDEDFQVPLLVENIGGPAASIFDLDQYASFLNGLPSILGYIVDLGHAHLNSWDLSALLGRIGPRIRAFHLHDNDSTSDSHLPLGKGTIDWEGTLGLIGNLGGEPAMVLEYGIGTELSHLSEGKAFLEDREYRAQPRRRAADEIDQGGRK